MKAQTTTPTPIKSAEIAEPTPEMLEQIRARAYELFEQRGGEQGHDLEDWLQAEAEITAEVTADITQERQPRTADTKAA